MIEMKDSWHDLEDCWILTQGFESMVGLRNAEDSFNQIFANSQCYREYQDGYDHLASLVLDIQFVEGIPDDLQVHSHSFAYARCNWVTNKPYNLTHH